MKAVLVLVLAVTACGQSVENKDSLMVDLSAKQKYSSRSEGEEQLGIASQSTDFFGRFGNVKTKAKGTPLKVALAFGNVVKFTVPSTQNNCHGSFAYEPDTANPKMANVFFYTATHCFELSNSLGMTLTQMSRANIGFDGPGSPAQKFATPYGAGNSLAAQISLLDVEVMFEGSLRTDVVRVLQGNIPLSEAQLKYLPTCSSVNVTSNRKKLALGEMVTDNQGVIQANGTRDVKLSGIGLPLTNQFPLQDAGISTVIQLDAVNSVPGESGGPVWMLDSTAKIFEIEEYLCLQGVISREVFQPEPNSLGGYEIKFNSYFTPVMGPSSTFSWVKVQ